MGRPAAHAARCSGPTSSGAASSLGGYPITREIKLYLIALVAARRSWPSSAKNLARSAVGRAFAAVRDRDLAAEVMGVVAHHATS